MIKRFFCVICLLSALLEGFEEKPWFGNLYEFYVDASYTFSRFSAVSRAVHQIRSPWNINLLTLDLGLSPVNTWDVQLELELASSPKQTFGRRSTALEVRTLLLDDIIGDLVSLSAGVSVRQTAHQSLRDISCPSSARYDFELNSAIGKEWSIGPDWRSRVYGLGAVGQGTHGSPWVRARAVYQMQKPEAHAIEFFALGYFGFGGKKEIYVNDFHGWGSYDHSSCDVGLGYRVDFGLWGYLRLDYAHRVYAKVYPKGTNSLLISYHLPFSLF